MLKGKVNVEQYSVYLYDAVIFKVSLWSVLFSKSCAQCFMIFPLFEDEIRQCDAVITNGGRGVDDLPVFDLVFVATDQTFLQSLQSSTVL